MKTLEEQRQVLKDAGWWKITSAITTFVMSAAFHLGFAASLIIWIITAKPTAKDTEAVFIYALMWCAVEIRSAIKERPRPEVNVTVVRADNSVIDTRKL